MLRVKFKEIVPQLLVQKLITEKMLLFSLLIMLELDEMFFNLGSFVANILGLAPSVLCSGTFNENVEQLKNKYAEDLPSRVCLEQQIFCWKSGFSNFQPEELLSTAAAYLKSCDPEMYLNIFTLIKICCTIPVTSCECEHNGSIIRRLNTCMRASMRANRLSSLAIIHVNYRKTVDLDDIVDILVRKHPRRMEPFSVLVSVL